jgi:predicted small lipoprotein YifL
MKTCQLLMFLALCPTLTGCGQIGPLYLPGTKPAIYVPPEPEPESKPKPEVKSQPNPQKNN